MVDASEYCGFLADLGSPRFYLIGGPAMPTIYPNPPKVCEMCGGDFEGVMYDARILRGQWAGRWSNLCRRCFHVSGCKLGVGFGKMYVQNVHGDFVQTKGRIKV
jgi:hypothetical protein